MLYFHRYREALVSLSAQLLQSMQFRHNQAQLEELDDETMDDDVSIVIKYVDTFCVMII
jgi:hypothetical protein